jgi:pantoate--beta-alanine ligase
MRIGLVPTMGAFHDGHLSLMRQARRECDIVVVSLFVNPAQFNEAADLAAYPRDAEGDAELAERTGADYLFAPEVAEIYPPGFATKVSVSGLTARLEGRHRGPGHFDGVTTVVAKLLNIVSPDLAYFGQKDAQQALVIRRMAEDLAFPVEIRVCPTVRDADGLALSSRNAHLSAEERERAKVLHRALRTVRNAFLEGEHDPGVVRGRALAELRDAGLEPDYVELVDPHGLEPLDQLDGKFLAVVAARVGATRLIDNELIQPVAAPRPLEGAENGRLGSVASRPA